MKQSTWLTLSVTLGWIASHFIYQAVFGAPDWAAAVERSYFTFIGQWALWIFLRGQFKDTAQ